MSIKKSNSIPLFYVDCNCDSSYSYYTANCAVCQRKGKIVSKNHSVFYQSKFSDIIIIEPFIDNWSTIHGSYFLRKGNHYETHLYRRTFARKR